MIDADLCAEVITHLVIMAHIRQSRPDSGLGFQVEALKMFQDVASSLDACYARARGAAVDVRGAAGRYQSPPCFAGDNTEGADEWYHAQVIDADLCAEVITNLVMEEQYQVHQTPECIIPSVVL